MEKWICKQCGYAHDGDEAPEHCPQCNAPKAQFYRQDKNGGCSMSFLVIVILAGLLIGIGLASCSTSKADTTTINSLNIDRYLGRWYEIARFDHRFERDMQQCTATYTLNNNGTIKIMNQGIKNGKRKTSTGKAKVTGQPGVLRVSFFGPFYSDYRILMLDPDYSYALIGGSNDKYLWILSRSPKLTSSTRNMILQEAQHRGYDTDKLIWVKHNN